MSYSRLLQQRLIRSHGLTPAEVKQRIGELWQAYERAIGDAWLEEQSPDGRFQDAYTAVRMVAEIVMLAEGYRPASGPGQHRAVFEFLGLVPSEDWSKEASYFQDCRRKRNVITYERTGVVTASEVETLIREAERFAAEAKAWLEREHRELI